MHGRTERADTKSRWQGIPTRRRVRMRLVVQCYLALVLAVGLGLVASAPSVILRGRMFGETTYLLRAGPADDGPLRAWGQVQPGVTEFRTERRGDNLWVRTEWRGSGGPRPPLAAMGGALRELGYELGGTHGGRLGLAGTPVELMMDPLVLALALAGMQAAFGVLGLLRIHAAARRGRPLPPQIPGRHGRALVAGLLGGLGLLAFGFLYSVVLKAWLGQPPPSPWESVAALPIETKLVFLVFGAVGAPVAEEVFFRGYLFGKCRREGELGFGMVLTAFLFGVVHFSDPYHIPGIWVFGLVLAWLNYRTGSLLAPIAAHMVNNWVAILAQMLGDGTG